MLFRIASTNESGNGQESENGSERLGGRSDGVAKGVTLGERYKNLPKEKATGMLSVICQHLGKNLPLTEEALLKTSEENRQAIARYLGNI